jgi:hypothetical protein
LSDKAEHDLAENLFYVFVNLNGTGVPDYYIVPRFIVAKTVSENHELWKVTKRLDGKDHNPTTMRSFQFAETKKATLYHYPHSAEYKNDEGWRLLGQQLGLNT